MHSRNLRKYGITRARSISSRFILNHANIADLVPLVVALINFIVCDYVRLGNVGLDLPRHSGGKCPVPRWEPAHLYRLQIKERIAKSRMNIKSILSAWSRPATAYQ